jgi:DeoR/GlpR family transcriptional regulator of sugar metabolism
LKGAERRLVIVERVAEQESIQVSDLSKLFGVSEMTVRRDIRRLEQEGFVRRTYGGATAHLTKSIDLAFNARSLQNSRAKRLIAMRAVDEIADAHTIFLGIGSTAEQFAQCLPARANLTVITSSIPIASLLGTRPVRVIVLGGEVRRDELSCIGPVAEETIDRYFVDVAVLGAAGISALHGVTDLNDHEAAIGRRVIQRARRVVLIADGTKFGLTAMAFVAPISEVDIIVTDQSAAVTELTAVRAGGVEVIIANEPSRDEH